MIGDKFEAATGIPEEPFQHQGHLHTLVAQEAHLDVPGKFVEICVTSQRRRSVPILSGSQHQAHHG